MRLSVVFIVSAILISSFCQAASPKMEVALKEFEKGQYRTALLLLSALSKESPKDLQVTYWVGQCHFKLQNYDEAAKSFVQTEVLQAQGAKASGTRDVPYLLGQSAYAIQDYPRAKAAFERSVKNKYKVGSSLYYIGYIQNLSNDDAGALETLRKVLALSEDQSDGMKMAARFQMGEVHFERGKKINADPKTNPKGKAQREKLLTGHAVPEYEKVIAMGEEKALAKQARGRIQEIRSLLSAETAKTESGLPKPRQPWFLKASEDVKYDSNIINEADGKLVKVEHTGSFYAKTGVFAKVETFPWKWLATTPEVDASTTLHFRRGTPAVFSNDSLNINPAIRNRIDHTMGAKPAAALVEFEGTYTARDYLSKHEFSFYSKSINYVLGERLQIFPWKLTGQSTIKLMYKYLWHQNHKQNYTAPSLSFAQNWSLANNNMLSTTFTYEYQRSNDPFYDQKTYKVASTYSLSSLPWGMTGDASFTVTFTDTMNQSLARATEKTYNPSFTLTKHFGSQINAGFNYAYTFNDSKDEVNYQYTKHVFGLSGAYNF